jgi:hypothetical protein
LAQDDRAVGAITQLLQRHVPVHGAHRNFNSPLKQHSINNGVEVAIAHLLQRHALVHGAHPNFKPLLKTTIK